MAEQTNATKRRVRRIRHRGRGSQVLIYLGKQFRFFINESDWKVLPMAGIIAFLVSMVIRSRLFANMEGALMGGFALTCVAIWNGAFNSIQAVCRERPIIKREHRSGMHITSYVAAHMIYQAFLCVLQTVLTIYVMILSGVRFPESGFMTPYMPLDIGISMLLISYASDMMSLFLSSISHTTTGAMTIMPFVLIFQLVFSGGIIPLPSWSRTLSDYTISSYGINAIVSQTGYNELPMAAVWTTLSGMRDNEVGGTVTLGQLMDALDSPTVAKRRDMEIVRSYTVGEAAEILSSAEESLHLREQAITRPVRLQTVLDFMRTSSALAELREKPLQPVQLTGEPLTVGQALDALAEAPEMQEVLAREVGTTLTLGEVLDALRLDAIAADAKDQKLNPPVTLGQIADFVKGNSALQAQRDRTFTFKITLGELFDLVGEDTVRAEVQNRTAAAASKPEYSRTVENIVGNWIMLGLFILLYAFLSVVVLELIDKDKR